ncbi:hypothetical protein [Nocardia pseudovaccinii]|uniref:hypothetical protein n=1 Tax=Nocardia pseudovaccinii TaxID=189540 RepID=UPI0007A46FB1|nr:hypothetical protein [Nocardia pseudovaccinii]
MQTRLTRAFDLGYPIVLAPMDTASGARFDVATMIVGEVAGLIHGIAPAGDIVRRTTEEAAELLVPPGTRAGHDRLVTFERVSAR